MGSQKIVFRRSPFIHPPSHPKPAQSTTCCSLISIIIITVDRETKQIQELKYIFLIEYFFRLYYNNNLIVGFVHLPETDVFIRCLAVCKLENCNGSVSIATSTCYLILDRLHAIVFAIINLLIIKTSI